MKNCFRYIYVYNVSHPSPFGCIGGQASAANQAVRPDKLGHARPRVQRRNVANVVHVHVLLISDKALRCARDFQDPSSSWATLYLHV